MQAVAEVPPFGLEAFEELLILGRCLAFASPLLLTQFFDAEARGLLLTLDLTELVWHIGHDANFGTGVDVCATKTPTFARGGVPSAA